MRNVKATRNFGASIALIGVFLIFQGISNVLFAQTQRNPVLEYCTGTWCGFCPQGHAIINNTILPNIPNAIIIGYHGPANGSDPMSFFYGNSIIASLGFSAYPTGIVDRVSGIISRSAWYSTMNNRLSVPATVSININRSYNAITRELNASIDFTALQALNGQFKYNAILLEDGIVYPQSGGSSNYVHRHVVRAMMNGALGEEIINGAWNQGQVITKSFSYTVPANFVDDSCHIVVFVYKNGSPLNSNAEIQQAEQWTLISPDYVAFMIPDSPDAIAPNNAPVQFDAVLRNEGLMSDKYAINLSFTGPTGWNLQYTTVNGTFTMGQVDSLELMSGDTTVITVTVDPNSIDGYGVATLEFASKNNPGLAGQVDFRFVTTTGIDILVVDAEDKDYETFITNSLDHVFTGTYGVVSRTALHPTGVDLSNFDIITWSQGKTFPAFYPEEVNSLQTYLDGGGMLFINGQDIGADIFEPNGQSSFAQSFYNNYLHADYVANASTWFLMKGYAGDPITDGIQFVLGGPYTKSPEIIAPFDANATSILKYYNGPSVGAIRAATNTYRVVYLGIGFEQIDQESIRDTLMARSIAWLYEGISGIGDKPIFAHKFLLMQNYPNPFNPETTIRYLLDNPTPKQTELIIYNSLGQQVKTLVSAKQPAGSYKVSWNGKDDNGHQVASGIYYYRLKSGDKQFTQKMILLR